MNQMDVYGQVILFWHYIPSQIQRISTHDGNASEEANRPDLISIFFQIIK